MVDLAMGVGSLALLIPTNNIILDFAKQKPHLATGVPGMSMFVNAIIVLGYGLFLKSYATDEKLFIGGILIAIFISMITKLRRLLNDKK